jgi:hypothetical protein
MLTISMAYCRLTEPLRHSPVVAYAVIVAAIAAGCFVAFPILSEQVHAKPPVQAVAPRTEAPAIAATCGQNAWPYLDATCLRSATGPVIAPREVRFVSADRLNTSGR